MPTLVLTNTWSVPHSCYRRISWLASRTKHGHNLSLPTHVAIANYCPLSSPLKMVAWITVMNWAWQFKFTIHSLSYWKITTRTLFDMNDASLIARLFWWGGGSYQTRALVCAGVINQLRAPSQVMSWHYIQFEQILNIILTGICILWVSLDITLKNSPF